jgi:copper chaperone
MLRFNVSGMTCDHCAQTVSKAVRSVDPGAKVDVDLAAGEVAVQGIAEATKIAAAIEAAGYVARQKAA